MWYIPDLSKHSDRYHVSHVLYWRSNSRNKFALYFTGPSYWISRTLYENARKLEVVGRTLKVGYLDSNRAGRIGTPEMASGLQRRMPTSIKPRSNSPADYPQPPNM